MAPSTRRRSKHTEVLKQQQHKQLLVDTPLDVLIEIFLLLEPVDLLHLARTSKVLRDFLLNRRRASALWRNVMDNVEGFPPCPDHMSAPAYTYLAFVPVCHRCLCPCETVEWELRMRCCPDCLPKMTISRSSILNKTSTYLRGLHLPTAYKHYKLFYGIMDITVYHETIHSDHYHSRLDWRVAQSRKQPRCFITEDFLSQQNEYWGSIRKHAELCQHWEHGKLMEKAAQLSLVRRQRVQDIKDKLRELGWVDIWFSSQDDFMQLPEVRKVEPLTPTEWAKIHPELINWAQKTRKNVITKLCISTFTSVFAIIEQELSSNSPLRAKPQKIDIAILPAVRAVFESDMLQGDIDPNTIRDDLERQLFRVLRPAIRKWSADAVEVLEQLAREQLGLPSLSKPSSLPSVIFRCNRCPRSVKRRSRFTFNEALSHNHLYREKEKERQTRRNHNGEMSLYDKFLAGYWTCPWNVQVFRVDVTVSRRVENLIRRMGRIPGKVTFDELRRSTVKVVCGLCNPEAATKMNFERALDHCLGTHVNNKETEVWTRADARK